VFIDQLSETGGANDAAMRSRTPQALTGQHEWDVTVQRKLQGDDALWLLINVVFAQTPASEIGGQIDVESRNLIMDQ